MATIKEKLVTTREASYILGISEKEIIELAKSNLIPHFKLGGEFMRFKKADLVTIKPAIIEKFNLPAKSQHRLESLREFIYFNDFYIVSAGLITFLLWMIVRDFMFQT